MEKQRKSLKRHESVESGKGLGESADTEGEDVISMADSSITIEDLEGELSRINRIRDLLVRRESELRYMMDDIQLCKEITRLKRELHKLVSAPDADKSSEDREKETELLRQIQRLVETRDFLVDDVELERLSLPQGKRRGQGNGRFPAIQIPKESGGQRHPVLQGTSVLISVGSQDWTHPAQGVLWVQLHGDVGRRRAAGDRSGWGVFNLLC
ncbi:bMERB domain-containing protein 1-like isoform X1 [Brienomyrus brachyistius]|uniref:bMERB domain-containing protein 1-like isoform X1 n=1 Tax=Brienomyrus brachyistius TaxID=42636 RepID=UPI0020B45AA2|nr:bMERB domain-containing protein 1-like isoform X1 [Brienomyrus brachyistius]